MEMSMAEMCEMSSEELRLFFLNVTKLEDGNGTVDEFMSRQSEACEQLQFHQVVSWLVPIIFAVIVVVGVIGNTLVLVVVLFGNQMRNTTNVLILNLAISDLLFVTVCIPPTAVDYAIGWPFGDSCCKIVQYLIHISLYGSVYTLVLLSLDRYLAVVYPVRSISLRTVCNTTVAIGIIWFLTALTCIPVLFVFISKDISILGEVRTICTFNRMAHNEEVYQSLFFITSLAMPLVAIMWLYMAMLIRLWRGSAATHGPGPVRDRKNVCKGQENKRRVTRMIVAVIIVFGICWSPLQVVLLLRNVNLYDITDSGALVVIQIITHCLAYCNSCLNPILYAFFSPNFRTAFLNTCSSNKYFRNSFVSKQNQGGRGPSGMGGGGGGGVGGGDGGHSWKRDDSKAFNDGLPSEGEIMIDPNGTPSPHKRVSITSFGRSPSDRKPTVCLKTSANVVDSISTCHEHPSAKKSSVNELTPMRRVQSEDLSRSSKARLSCQVKLSQPTNKSSASTSSPSTSSSSSSSSSSCSSLSTNTTPRVMLDVLDPARPKRSSAKYLNSAINSKLRRTTALKNTEVTIETMETSFVQV